MEDLFGAHAVLFECEEEGEHVRIECAMRKDGGLALLRSTDGPLTEWLLGESPHRVEADVDAVGASMLAGRLGLEDAGMLPACLRVRYVGFDSDDRIRRLLRELAIPYGVIEDAPAR